MKKVLLLAILCLGLNCSLKAQVYQTEREAAQAAKAICNEFGQKAKGGTAKDHTGAIKYNTSSKYEDSKNGPQNSTRINANLGVKKAAVNASGGVEYERSGEQKNSKKETQRNNSGYLYYKCED